MEDAGRKVRGRGGLPAPQPCLPCLLCFPKEPPSAPMVGGWPAWSCCPQVSAGGVGAGPIPEESPVSPSRGQSCPGGTGGRGGEPPPAGGAPGCVCLRDDDPFNAWNCWALWAKGGRHRAWGRQAGRGLALGIGALEKQDGPSGHKRGWETRACRWGCCMRVAAALVASRRRNPSLVLAVRSPGPGTESGGAK